MRFFNRARRGAQAMEFALTLPVLALVASATVDWGWYFHQSMAVTQAAVQGNRAAAKEENSTTAVTVGQAIAVSVWDAGPGSAAATAVTVVNDTAPREVTTTVTATYQCLICIANTNNTLRHTAVDHYPY